MYKRCCISNERYFSFIKKLSLCFKSHPERLDAGGWEKRELWETTLIYMTLNHPNQFEWVTFRIFSLHRRRWMVEGKNCFKNIILPICSCNKSHSASWKQNLWATMRFGWYVSVSSEGSELLGERETIEEDEEREPTWRRSGVRVGKKKKFDVITLIFSTNNLWADFLLAETCYICVWLTPLVTKYKFSPH